MKSIFLKDYLASRVICEDKKVNGYDKVFYKTNEDLLDIYLDIDFYDKDVLSVQASGDQVLTARFLDAKNVDSFDINRLTLYYFYLRLWSIKYRDKLYPEVEDGNKWIRKLVSEVEPNSEMEKKALDFYKMHLKKNTNIENMFFAIEAQEEGKTLFTNAEELKDNLSPKIKFKEMDLFKKNKTNRKYDIALISNILEWAKNDDRESYDKLFIKYCKRRGIDLNNLSHSTSGQFNYSSQSEPKEPSPEPPKTSVSDTQNDIGRNAIPQRAKVQGMYHFVNRFTGKSVQNNSENESILSQIARLEENAQWE